MHGRFNSDGTVRRSAFVALLLTLSLIVTACGASDQPPADNTKVKTEVKFGLLPSSVFVPIYIAEQMGYFDEEGIKIELVPGTGGPAMMPLVVQGELQFAVSPIDAAIAGLDQKLGLGILNSPTFIADEKPPAQTATLVRKDSEISEVADLKGKTIAVNSVRGQNWLVGQALLEKAGVNPKDVTYVEVPFPNMVDALSNGSVDAIVVPEPFIHVAQKTVGARVLAYDFVEVQPGMTLVGLTASKRWVKENPKAAAGVQRAIMRGVEYMVKEPEKAFAMAAKFTGIDPALVKAAGLPTWTTEPLVAKDMQFMAQLMVRYGLLNVVPELDGLLLSVSSGK